MNRIVLVGLAALVWLTGAAWGQAAQEGQELDPNAPVVAGELSEYFGFGEMEIFKLEAGMLSPQIVDINGDGLNDVAVVNNRKARIELLLQKPGFEPGEAVAPEPDPEDINDLFGVEATWRFKRVSHSLDVGVFSLAAADFNGDGRVDLAYYGTDGLYVVLQERPEEEQAGPEELAEPRWQAPQRYDVTEAVKGEGALRAGDLNDDGRTDLAALAADGVFLLYQQEDGALAVPERYYSGGENLRWMGVADLDGDGREDLAVLSGRREERPLRVRLGRAGGRLGPELSMALPMPTALHTAELAAGGGAQLFSIAQSSGRLEVRQLARDGTQGEWAVSTYPLPSTDKPGDRDVVAADLDGDGLLDVVASDPSRAEFLLFRASAADSLAPAESFPGFKDMQKLVGVDLDGSGEAAVVCLSVEEKLVGISRLEQGRLTFPEIVATAGEPQAMEVGDVDGDGSADLVYVAQQPDESGRQAYYLRVRLGLGREEASGGPEVVLGSLRDKPADLRLADIDRDGRLDVLVVRAYEPLLLVRQNEEGEFVEETSEDIRSGLVSQVFRRALSLTELASETGHTALVVRKNYVRALRFETGEGWVVQEQYQAADPRSSLAVAAAVRLRPEGPLQIAAYDEARQRLVLLAPGEGGTYRVTEEIELGAVTAQKVLAGDFGGSAETNLLVCGATRLVRVGLGQAGQTLREVGSYESEIKEGRYGEVATGDLNGDGCPDVVVCEQNRNHVQVLTFDGEGELTSGLAFKVFETPGGEQGEYAEGRRTGGGEPRLALVGDLTGDGREDLLLLVHDRLILYPQDY